MDVKEVKEQIQKYIYEMNYPSRVGNQPYPYWYSPFKPSGWMKKDEN